MTTTKRAADLAACGRSRGDARDHVRLTVGQQAALARLGCALERPGSLAVLCGPAGSGTTAVLGHLESIAARSCRVARISLRDRQDVAADDATGLVIADDAHEAVGDALGRLVRATRAHAPEARLVLAGRGRLFTLLARDVGIEAQVTLRAILRPFSAAESAALLAATCTATGVPDDALAEVAETIHEIAGGLPAAVVRMAHVALLVRSSSPTRRIAADDIESLHRRVALEAA